MAATSLRQLSGHGDADYLALMRSVGRRYSTEEAGCCVLTGFSNPALISRASR